MLVLAAACGREAPAPPPPAQSAAPSATAPSPASPLPAAAPAAALTGEPFQTTNFAGGAGAARKAAVKGTLDAFPARPGEPDGVHLRVRIEGLRPGSHAWHIHSGPCSEIGRVIVALTPADTMQGIVQPLAANAEGTAEGTVFIPLNRLSRQRMELRAYSLRVHVPGGDHNAPSEACARL